jgi:hypothetical protein
MGLGTARGLVNLCVCTVVTLAACDEKGDLDQNARPPGSPWHEERDLLSDPSRAAPELERRLRAFLAVREGLIIVRHLRQREVYTLPVDSPWIVSCGFGLTLHLGGAPEGDHEDIASLVEVSLTRLFLIPPSLCEQLAPAVGKTLQRILAGG